MAAEVVADVLEAVLPSKIHGSGRGDLSGTTAPLSDPSTTIVNAFTFISTPHSRFTGISPDDLGRIVG